jgi:hypothetical protein
MGKVPASHPLAELFGRFIAIFGAGVRKVLELENHLILC